MKYLAPILSVMLCLALCQFATAQRVQTKRLYDLPHQLTPEGRLREAKMVLEKTEKAVGKNHVDVAWALERVAGLSSYREAEPLYLRALKIRELKQGKNHPQVASCLDSLAWDYQREGRHSEAEPLFKRSLKIRELKLGKDDPDVASSLDRLAELYKTQGRYSEAEPLFKRSLAIRELNRDKDQLPAGFLVPLALLYQAQERYDEAEPMLKRALIRRGNWTRDPKWAYSSENDLAMLYIEWGNLLDAEPLARRLPPSSPAFGMWHLRNANYEKAKQSYTALLNNVGERRDADKLFVAYTGLGAAQEGLGNYKEAMEYYTQGRELVDKLASGVDPSHRKTFLEVKVGGFKRSEPAEGLKRVEMKLNRSTDSPAE